MRNAFVQKRGDVQCYKYLAIVYGTYSKTKGEKTGSIRGNSNLALFSLEENVLGTGF